MSRPGVPVDEEVTIEEGEPMGLAELAALRRSTYGVLGSLFLYPDDQRVSSTVAAAAELRRESDLARTFPYFPRRQGLLESLESLDGESIGRLQEEHVKLFLFGGDQPACPPYESAYLDGADGARGLKAARLERVYAGAGIGLSASMAGELPDHVALELEFLSLLCAEEEDCWRDRQPAQAGGWLEHQGSFLGEHLGRWFPLLARCVGARVDPASLYRQLVDTTHAFLVHDNDLIGALMETSSQAKAPNSAAQV